MQMGDEIRVSIDDVDSGLLLSRYWPPSTSVHRGSCLETNSTTTDQKAWTRTKKYKRTCTESVKFVYFGKVWPLLDIIVPLTGCVGGALQ